MSLIRRYAWAIVILGTVAGCTSEEPTAPTPPPMEPPGAAPQIAPPPKAEPSKEAASKEATPPPAKAEEPKKGSEPPKIEGPKTEGKGDTAAVTLTPDEIAAIKELPAADQPLALKQAVCPVSDEHLGAMDKPYKTSADSRTVFLCCKNCEQELKADPKKFLAKLDAKAGKK